MATYGVGLAEAYVMRSLHKEKMKKMDKQQASKSEEEEEENNNKMVFDDEMKMPASCFSRVSKKTHFARVSDASGKPNVG
ncbi:hypothetical protein Golax_003119 [Gossypium laxum]|uniref:Uncharacterized protein n=2 Tax=Gossypium TaxID=3633 RepID=A0A7J8MSW7_9ROSI|nr:hypothetical protein [Gossypium lobatum]MBA0722442.1 hypothetical protein [Gossypium laxum]